MYYNYYSNELYHHGIKGMKWGVRRYQNKDGSLTNAGKTHSLVSTKKRKMPGGIIEERDRNHESLLNKLRDRTKVDGITKSNIPNNAKTLNSNKNIKKMSDKELHAKIKRLELEKKYKDLEKSTSSEGRRFATEVLQSIGKKTLTTAGAGALLYLGKYAVTGKFNPNELGNAIFYGGAKKK